MRIWIHKSSAAAYYLYTDEPEYKTSLGLGSFCDWDSPTSALTSLCPQEAIKFLRKAGVSSIGTDQVVELEITPRFVELWEPDRANT